MDVQEVFYMDATKVNFKTEAVLKERAEKLFKQMGMNMTTALNLFLKATVQQGQIPFKVMGDDAANREWIYKALIEAQAQAADTNTKWLTEKEAFERFDTKYGL
jgi:DNA-damage-inducible protein J